MKYKKINIRKEKSIPITTQELLQSETKILCTYV